MKKIVREIENELRTLATRIEVLKKGIVQWGTFEIADGSSHTFHFSVRPMARISTCAFAFVSTEPN